MCSTQSFLKVYYHISPEPEMEQALMLMTSNIPSYNLPGLNVKIPDKSLSRRKLEKDTGPIYCKPEQTLTYMSQHEFTELYRSIYRSKEEFQWAQRDFLIYIMKDTYWQKINLTGSMLSFLTIVFFIFFHSHSRIMYAALMSLEEILKFTRQIWQPYPTAHYTRTVYLIHTGLITTI